MTVYFDLDGTLIDSSIRHGKLLEDIFLDLGIETEKYSAEAYLNYKRDGKNTFSYLTNCLCLENNLADKVCKLWVEHIEDEKYLDQDVLFPETIDALNILSEKKIPVVYVSARRNKQGVVEWLKDRKIDRFAEDIFIVDSINATKEKLKVLLPRIKQDDCLVGDTEVEWETGKKLGIETIILNRGFRSKSFWNDKQVHSYESILEGLKGLL